jgi:hypothetical protein
MRADAPETRNVVNHPESMPHKNAPADRSLLHVLKSMQKVEVIFPAILAGYWEPQEGAVA